MIYTIINLSEQLTHGINHHVLRLQFAESYKLSSELLLKVYCNQINMKVRLFVMIMVPRIWNNLLRRMRKTHDLNTNH